jgi:hypothetical protein
MWLKGRAGRRHSTMKRCKKCGGVKPLTEFYRHPTCGDGRLGACKECRLKYTAEWYQKNKPERDSYRKSYYDANPVKQRQWGRTARRNLYRKAPQKVLARNALSAAKRTGRIRERPCEICGALPTDGHHEDYSKPLEVRWLCQKHHKQLHKERKPV